MQFAQCLRTGEPCHLPEVVGLLGKEATPIERQSVNEAHRAGELNERPELATLSVVPLDVDCAVSYGVLQHRAELVFERKTLHLLLEDGNCVGSRIERRVWEQ